MKILGLKRFRKPPPIVTVIATDGWGASEHQASHPREAGNHLDADMAAKRPIEHDRLGHTQFSEQLDGGVREAGAREALRGIRRVAGLAVTR